MLIQTKALFQFPCTMAKHGDNEGILILILSSQTAWEKQTSINLFNRKPLRPQTDE